MGKTLKILPRTDEAEKMTAVARKNNFILAALKISKLGHSSYFVYPHIHTYSRFGQRRVKVLNDDAYCVDMLLLYGSFLLRIRSGNEVLHKNVLSLEFV